MTNDLMQELTGEQDVDLERSTLVGLLRAAYEAKEARDLAARAYDQMTKLMRAYLERNPEEVLFDGENKIECKLSKAPTVNNYDLADCPWDLIQEMHRARLLVVNHASVKALTDARLKEQVNRYYRPGEGTPRLSVERLKE